MKIKQLLSLMLMMGITFALSAQDASFYRKYAEKGDKEAMYNLAECYLNGTGGVQENMNQATYWLTKATKKNYAPAQVKLAYCYIMGVGVLKDYKMAWDLANKAMKNENPQAHALVAYMYRDGIYVPQSDFKWAQYLKSAANLGSTAAQYEYGKAMLIGDKKPYIPESTEQGLKWLKTAASQNDEDAQFLLGFCYDNAYGVSENKVMALKYYQDAADNGEPNAMAIMGEKYLKGDGVEQDFDKAHDYINAGILRDNPRSYYLGAEVMYYGLGVEADIDKAAKWYKVAAENGVVDAYVDLARFYINGLGGMKQDERLGFEWMKKAADEDDVNGLAGVASCYHYGQGVNKNTWSAIDYYKKAADKGDAFSQYNLYRIYRYGDGVPSNNSEALKYLRLAADQGDVDALHSLGYEYNEGVLLHREPSKSLEYLQKAANGGNIYSIATLGLLYYEGDFLVSRDYDKAYEYLYMAACNPDSLDDDTLGSVYRDLAACYRFGRGTAVDHSMASYCTEMAAKHGDSGSYDAVNALRN